MSAYAAQPAPSRAHGLKTRQKAPTMLMVEDNPADVRLAQEAFKASGSVPNLSVVKDGAEALRYLRRESPYENAERPDIIFLDLNLPKVNGAEVLQAIKND